MADDIFDLFCSRYDKFQNIPNIFGQNPYQKIPNMLHIFWIEVLTPQIQNKIKQK